MNKNQLKEVDTPQSLQKTHGNIQPFFFCWLQNSASLAIPGSVVLARRMVKPRVGPLKDHFLEIHGNALVDSEKDI